MTTVRKLARPVRRAQRQLKQRLRERRDPTMRWLMTDVRKQAIPDELHKDAWDRRRRLIAELAPGKSFLDMCGMYGVAGEAAFTAEQAGASRVTIFDGMDATPEFDERHRAAGSHIEFVQGDLHDPADIAALGTFDVVWFTGVIYHTPHPMLQLQLVRQVATETAVIGTHVIPEVEGVEQACVLYPGSSPAMQEAYKEMNELTGMHYGGPEHYPGMMVPFDTTPLMAYANMWFAFSPSALRSMLRLAGFEPVDELVYTPYWMDVVNKLGGISPEVYPVPGQSGARLLERYAGVADDALPPYSQRQVRALRDAQGR
jgi:hypothetical protein